MGWGPGPAPQEIFAITNLHSREVDERLDAIHDFLTENRRAGAPGAPCLHARPVRSGTPRLRVSAGRFVSVSLHACKVSICFLAENRWAGRPPVRRQSCQWGSSKRAGILCLGVRPEGWAGPGKQEALMLSQCRALPRSLRRNLDRRDSPLPSEKTLS